ncbi:MAG: macro domain-containing protein [Deltaproteobacteria bacterium]|nr:macro domain-containing protein [Deltaproteobacteria bacterium]
MIEFKTGDILQADAEAIVNTVNCVGVMGRGVALQFKNAFPANFKAYAAACKRDEVQPGRMFVFETGRLANPRYIINFPTKRHWKGKSRMEDVEAGLTALTAEIQQRGIRSIALPPLGAGLGGLEWQAVRGRIDVALGTLAGVLVTVFEPHADADVRPAGRTGKVPEMTAGRAALVGLMRRYLRGLMDPSVSLLEVHKLMYFMQEAGEPLRLRYVKAPYGPYAENLRHVLREIDGYFVFGYANGGDAPDKELALVPGAVQDAERFLTGHPATQARFERVASLVEGFETPFGLELLATVHWVATHGESCKPDELIAQTYAWSDRKKQFSERQIRLALDTLTTKDWLPVE